MHEISIAEAEIPTAEGIPAIDGRNRAVDYARADVEGIDFEAIAKRTRFEKRDGNRVGLLAAGTWNAQESPSIGTVAASRRQQSRHGLEGAAIPEKPRLRYHYGIDELAKLFRLGLQTLEIGAP